MLQSNKFELNLQVATLNKLLLIDNIAPQHCKVATKRTYSLTVNATYVVSKRTDQIKQAPRKQTNEY